MIPVCTKDWEPLYDKFVDDLFLSKQEIALSLSCRIPFPKHPQFHGESAFVPIPIVGLRFSEIYHSILYSHLLKSSF